MFKKILIANRNEIALRVIRACRELGIETVAIYSKADENALHVKFADEAVCIGPPQALKSYLYQPAVLAAAEITGADAVHPGYRFLAENAQFAKGVAAMGKTFIGPSVEHLGTFGDKLSAKEAARAAGLPLLSGSTGAVKSVDEAIGIAKETGFPVILKAAGGGGGKGMRIVEDEAQLLKVFEITQNEARAAFGNGDVFIERFLRAPRHVEVQVAGDGKGGGVHVLTAIARCSGATRRSSRRRRHRTSRRSCTRPSVMRPRTSSGTPATRPSARASSWSTG